MRLQHSALRLSLKHEHILLPFRVCSPPGSPFGLEARPATKPGRCFQNCCSLADARLRVSACFGSLRACRAFVTGGSQRKEQRRKEAQARALERQREERRLLRADVR